MFGLDRRLIGGTTGKWISVGVAAGVGLVILSMALVTIIGDLVDFGLAGEFPIARYLPWLAALIAARIFLGWLNRIGQYHASSETKLTVRDKIYKHAMRLGPGIIGEKRTGELVNMAVDGMEWLELFFGVYFVQFLIGILTPLLLCAFVFFIDWAIGAALLISIPLTPMFLGMFAQRFSAVSKRYFEMNSHLSAQFLDNLQGMVTLKLFNQAVPRGNKVREETEKNRVETMRLLLVNQVMIFFTDWGFALGTTVVMTAVALLRMRAGFVTPGEVIALVLISSEFARPLNLIGAFFFAGAIGREVSKKTVAFLDEVPSSEEGTKPDTSENGAAEERGREVETPTGEIGHGLTFREVTFTYRDAAEPACAGISFEVEPGETVALRKNHADQPAHAFLHAPGGRNPARRAGYRTDAAGLCSGADRAGAAEPLHLLRLIC
jgi:ABC-type transport system involved in cytochrome bd biosynthesis fused ATPase/permease subunit